MLQLSELLALLVHLPLRLLQKLLDVEPLAVQARNLVLELTLLILRLPELGLRGASRLDQLRGLYLETVHLRFGLLSRASGLRQT